MEICSKSTKKEALTLWKLPVVFMLDFGQLFKMCLGKRQICDDAFFAKIVLTTLFDWFLNHRYVIFDYIKYLNYIAKMFGGNKRHL